MMHDTVSPVRNVDGLVRVTGDDGQVLTTFAGHDLPSWRQFQLDVFSTFNIVVSDGFMPVEISRLITGPDKRDDKFVPSG
ncbi:hypothetical protein CWB41_07905 [Methylovirgula ligni]|uniref:Uncharacterized protein n=1 Tax=Methylovirgula ligni TaxID=569860 RepID=A0A3D9Z2A8_9HYPH|nr:hypothetical protein [Methylovirgula ligni]QAY95669.1 hypothetical protein CWB41_07905 [Methylovirgula ligni]REF88965.1 hypothetical protein DES32_0177 [Methylovirgula ligni]